MQMATLQVQLGIEIVCDAKPERKLDLQKLYNAIKEQYRKTRKKQTAILLSSS